LIMNHKMMRGMWIGWIQWSWGIWWLVAGETGIGWLDELFGAWRV
jgi:hypothetical protein